MKRKDFIKKGIGSAAGLAAGVTLINGCNSDSGAVPEVNINLKKTFSWKMTTVWGKNFPVLGESCNMLAEWVKKMSGGRLDIKVFGSGELAPGLESFYTTSVGTTEMGAGAAYYWQGITPASAFFASIPLGMNAQQIQAWMLGGDQEGYNLWKEVYADFNLVPLMAGNTGVQMGGWFNKEINSIEDIKGLKMRIPGIAGKALVKAGGAAITVNAGELYTNLERGVIDATEWIGPYHDYLLGLNKAAKYYYTPGWHECGTQLEFLVNKKAYESLPDDLREILYTASIRAHAWVLSEFDAKNAEYLQKMIEEGVDIRQYPEEVMRQMKKYSDEAVQELVGSDETAKKVYNSFNSFRKKISAWSDVTEKVYYGQLMDL